MRPLILTVVLAVGPGCTAQVVLTDANSSPQPGDVYVRHTGSYVDPGGVGGPIPTYDYTSLGGGWVDTLRYTAPSDTMWFSGLVPAADAELLTWDVVDGHVLYYSGTDAGLDLVGELEAGVLYTMSNPMKMLVYPCSPGSSWTDTYYGIGPWGEDKAGVVSVTSSTECNVSTPSGSFSNVLRLVIQRSLDYTSNGNVILHREQSITVYRKPGIHHPIMYCIRSTGYDQSGDPIPGLYGERCEWLQTDLVTTIQPMVTPGSTWTLVRNPVEDLLRVAGYPDTGTSVYRIRNADGRLVREGAARDLRDGVKVDDLSGGIYLLQCGGPAARFIKE